MNFEVLPRLEDLPDGAITPASTDLAARLSKAYDLVVPPANAYPALSVLLAAFDDITREEYALSLPTPTLTISLEITEVALGVAVGHAKGCAPDEEVLESIPFDKLCAIARMDHAVTDVRWVFADKVADLLFEYLKCRKVAPHLVHPIFDVGTARCCPQLCGLLVETHRGYAAHPAVHFDTLLWVTCHLASDSPGWNPWHYVLVALLRSGADPFTAISSTTEAPIVTLCEGSYVWQALVLIKLFWPHEKVHAGATVTAVHPYSAPLSAVLDARGCSCTPLLNYVDRLTAWQAVLTGVPARLTLLVLEDGLADPLADWYATLNRPPEDAEAALLARGALQPIHKAPVLWNNLDRWAFEAFLLAQLRLRRACKPHVNRDASNTVALFYRRSIRI